MLISGRKLQILPTFFSQPSATVLATADLIGQKLHDRTFLKCHVSSTNRNEVFKQVWKKLHRRLLIIPIYRLWNVQKTFAEGQLRTLIISACVDLSVWNFHCQHRVPANISELGDFGRHSPNESLAQEWNRRNYRKRNFFPKISKPCVSESRRDFLIATLCTDEGRWTSWMLWIWTYSDASRFCN